MTTQANNVAALTSNINSPGVLQPGGGGLGNTTGSEFAAGTALLFSQTSAPTGWTKSTSSDNAALRIVSGSVGSGGSVNFNTAFASQTVAGNNSWPSIAALNSSQSNNSTTVGVGAATQITDPTVSYKLLDYYGNYNNQPYSQFLQRQFPGGSIHQYNQVVVPQTWHQAYFVGINYVTAFYENTYDDLRAIPGTLLSSNMTTSGFLDSGTNYVTLITDQVAYTPFFKTIDSFSSFNVAGLTTDWRSFLTNGASPANDPTLMNNLTSYLPDMSINSTLTDINTLGISSVYSVTQHTPNVTYGIKSVPPAETNPVIEINSPTKNLLTAV